MQEGPQPGRRKTVVGGHDLASLFPSQDDGDVVAVEEANKRGDPPGGSPDASASFGGFSFGGGSSSVGGAGSSFGGFLAGSSASFGGYATVARADVDEHEYQLTESVCDSVCLMQCINRQLQISLTKKYGGDLPWMERCRFWKMFVVVWLQLYLVFFLQFGVLWKLNAIVTGEREKTVGKLFGDYNGMCQRLGYLDEDVAVRGCGCIVVRINSFVHVAVRSYFC